VGFRLVDTNLGHPTDFRLSQGLSQCLR
jgi:hypothetical protein